MIYVSIKYKPVLCLTGCKVPKALVMDQLDGSSMVRILNPELNLSKFLDLYKFNYQSFNNSDIISGIDYSLKYEPGY